MNAEIQGMLNANEEVITVWHRHSINLLPAATSVAAIIILVLGGAYGTGRYRDTIATVLPVGIVQIGLLIISLLAVFIGLASLYIYRRNALVLTSTSILQIEQIGLFSHTVSKLSLANLEDVSSHRTGFMATIFNYGSLVIETAGEQENFSFEQAPRPSEMVETINRAHVAANNKRASEQAVAPVVPTVTTASVPVSPLDTPPV